MSARTPTPPPAPDEPVIPPTSYSQAAEWMREASKRHAKNRAQPELRRTGLTKGICLQMAEVLEAWGSVPPAADSTVVEHTPDVESAPAESQPEYAIGDTVTVAGTTFTKHGDDPFNGDPLAALHAAQAHAATVAESVASTRDNGGAVHTPLSVYPSHEFSFSAPPAPAGPFGDADDPDGWLGPLPEPQPTSVPGIDGTLIPALGIGDTVTPPVPDLTYYRMFSAPAPIVHDALVEPHGTGVSEVVTLRPDEPAANGHYAPGTEPVSVPKVDAGTWPASGTHTSWLTDALFPIASQPLILPYYSYSLVSAMNKCPMQVRLERFDRDDNGVRLPQLPGMWNAGGTAFHETIREYETSRADASLPRWNPDDAAQRFTDHFDYEIAKLTEKTGIAPDKWRVAQRGRETREWWSDKGTEWAATYVERRSDDYEILAIEGGTLALELGLTTPVGLFGAPVKMYIDQVKYYPKTGDIEVRDLKAGGRMPNDPLQLDTYGLALINSGLLPSTRRHVYGSMWNARQGEDTWSRVIEGEGHDNERTYEQTKYRYRSAVTAIARREFEPRPSMLCGSCGVRAFCPVMGDEGIKRPLTLPDEALTYLENHTLDESLMSD